MKRIHQALLLSVLSLVLSSFALITKNSDNPIPDDFDPRKTTLLVENYYYQYPPAARKLYFQKDSIVTKSAEADKTKEMAEDARKIMKDGYPYKYEFADAEDIKSNPKYTDKDLFRFVLIDDTHLIMETNGGQQSYDPYHQETSHWFVLYDRKMDKKYPRLRNGSFFNATFKRALEALVKFAQKK